jgi:hypothetical protein
MSLTEESLQGYDRKSLNIILKELLLKKAGIKYSGSSKDINQQLKSMGKLFDKKLKEDPEKYKKYEYNAQTMYTGLKVNQMIDGILAIHNKLESLGEGEEEFKPSVQKKGKDTIAEDFDEATAKIQEVYQKNKGKTVTKTMVKEFIDAYDKLKEVNADSIRTAKRPATEVSSKVIAEAGFIVKDKLKELENLVKDDKTKVEKVKKQKEELEKESKDYNKIRVNPAESEIADEKDLQRIYQNLGMIYMQNKMDKRRQQKEMSEMLGAEEEKEELEQKEDYEPKPVVGTDFQGSKEMYVKPEQKPVEPFGGLQSEKEINAPYLSTQSDKDIGNVREIGFVGAQDQLAKVDDVTLEPSERSKSLKRFTNFRWVQSVQNSDLGYASPFQRMDDIDDRRRYGKCFMHVNKMPKDPDTQEELEKAKGFNTYSLVPSFDMSSRMQPAGNLSFINSTSKFARKITGNDTAAEASASRASGQGMEPINQGKRNVNNLKNTLEFPTLLFSEDPLKKIKDKYKNNIVC